MTRKKILNRELLLTHKVGVRFDEKTHTVLKELVEKTNSQSIGELVRRIIVKDKIIFYAIDNTMNIPMKELIKIREELNAIGRNINQITHHFHNADTSSQKLFIAMKAKEEYSQIKMKVEELLSLISDLAGKWLSSEKHQTRKLEINLCNFQYRNPLAKIENQ